MVRKPIDGSAAKAAADAAARRREEEHWKGGSVTGDDVMDAVRESIRYNYDVSLDPRANPAVRDTLSSMGSALDLEANRLGAMGQGDYWTNRERLRSERGLADYSEIFRRLREGGTLGVTDENGKTLDLLGYGISGRNAAYPLGSPGLPELQAGGVNAATGVPVNQSEYWNNPEAVQEAMKILQGEAGMAADYNPWLQGEWAGAAGMGSQPVPAAAGAYGGAAEAWNAPHQSASPTASPQGGAFGGANGLAAFLQMSGGKNGGYAYDPDTDPIFDAYRRQYTAGAQAAMNNALGAAGARTGGMASSYATQAAQQAYGEQMQALSDKIPELEAMAYQRYVDQLDRESAAEQQQYERQVAAEQQAYERQLAAQELDTQQRADNANLLMSLMSGYGYMPTAEELAAAGLSMDMAQRIVDGYQQESRGSGGGGGYQSGGEDAQGVDWSRVEEYVTTGGTAEDYIGAYYKDMGFSSLSQAMSAWNVYQQLASLQPDDGTDLIVNGLSNTGAMSEPELWSTYATEMFSYPANERGMYIDWLLETGKISEVQAAQLRAALRR